MKRRSLIVSLVAIVTVAIGGVIATFVTDTKPQLGPRPPGRRVGHAAAGRRGGRRSRWRSSPTSCATASTAWAWPSRRSSARARHGRRQPAGHQGPGPGHRAGRPDRQGAVPSRAGRERSPTSRRGRRQHDHRARRSTTHRARADHDGGRSHRRTAAAAVDRDHRPRRRRPTAAAAGDPRRPWLPRWRRRSPLARTTRPRPSVVLPGRDGTVLYTMGPAFALGEDAISTSEATVINGEWVVDLELKGGEERPRRLEHLVGASASTGTPSARPAAWRSCSTARSSPRRSRRQPFFASTSVQVSGGGDRVRARPRPGTWAASSSTAACRCELEATGRPDRLGHAREGLAAGRPDRRLRRRRPRPDPDDPLLPQAGHPGGVGAVPHRLPALDHDLDPVEDLRACRSRWPGSPASSCRSA